MILGIDVSTYLEQQRLTHQKYYLDGKEVDPFQLFRNNGVTVLRTRIWNNPYDKDGNRLNETWGSCSPKVGDNDIGTYLKSK